MYSAVIIASLMSLSIFVTKNIKNTIKNNQLYLNQKIIESVNDCFKHQSDSSRTLINSLYSKPLELSDTLSFLSNDYETYIKRRLDDYSNSDVVSYAGINSFVKNCFSYNGAIREIIFYSYKDDSLRIYGSSGDLKYIYNIKSKLNLDYNSENFNRYIENMLNSMNKDDTTSYHYTFYDIRNPYKLENVGTFIVKYSLEEVDNIIKSYEKSKSYIIAVNKAGDVIYDSSNRYLNRKYPYLDRLKTTDNYVNLDERSYIDMATSSLGIIVLGVLPAKTVFEGSKIIVFTIYALAILLIVLAEIVTVSKIDDLSMRTQNILSAMKNVQKGKLNTRIALGKEDDEISLISSNFNDMCEKLDGYIKKVYLSEIKQKNAEMTALQSQINPHFLYNTLESIRMKAISNGDKEVGKMLYNLATLFRNMVKGKTFITINQELEHCKLYLELFKFRYEGKFDYCIDVEPELLNKEIIKFSIQPIIENFIVHGVRLEDDDNFILITLEKECEHIKICIQDNGVGIPEEKLEQINEDMKNLDNKRKSIGIINVHERLILTYGSEYGITIANREPRGTLVSIKIPCKEVDTDV